MTDQSINTLAKILLKLIYRSTSPKNALQLMSTSISAPEAFKGQKEPVLIFLAYARFIMNKQSGIRVEGIWGELVKNTFMYLGNDVSNYHFIKQFRSKYPLLSDWLGPSLKYDLSTWAVKVLCNHQNCPDPYARLQIFRLYVHFINDIINKINRRDQERECLETFIYTICEVNPYSLYSSGGYDPMFSIGDLYFMMLRETDFYVCDKFDIFHKFNGLTYISKVIQLIGIFAIRIRSDPDSYDDLCVCINVLSSFCKMYKQYTRQAIQKYVLETVCEITETAIFNKAILTEEPCAYSKYSHRDEMVKELAVSPKPYELPRLLFLRQVHGPRQVRQYGLLLPDLF